MQRASFKTCASFRHLAVDSKWPTSTPMWQLKAGAVAAQCSSQPSVSSLHAGRESSMGSRWPCSCCNLSLGIVRCPITSSNSNSSSRRRTRQLCGAAAAATARSFSGGAAGSQAGTVTSGAHASSSSSSAPRPPASGQEISSTSNGYIKHCVRLRESSRYRQQQQRLLVAGSTLLTELTDASPNGLQALVLFVKQGAAIQPELPASRVITITDAVMRKLTGLEETAGVQVAAELPMPPYVNLEQQQQEQEQEQQQQQQQQQPEGQQQLQLQRLLVLEGVQDPGNLGTLLRCAAAFGWDAVWLLPGCCDPFNDKALRASRGAGLKVPLATGTLEQLLQVVGSRNMLLLAAEPDPTAAAGPDSSGFSSSGLGSSRDPEGSQKATGSDCSGNRPVALVLGSEGSGLSAEVLSVAQPLAVPMVGDMESLNVGVAGSILMFCLSEGWGKLTERLQQLQLLVD